MYTFTIMVYIANVYNIFLPDFINIGQTNNFIKGGPNMILLKVIAL